MFLKQLTIKGFKSFADPATLEFEPGITVVVGPNGSGKSNVVDAIAWVLGAQAPKSVRSQKMDDVIFAGTKSRKPLGRAEVSITIDNSDQVLPIEFTEVTVTRTLFRTGESEYAINAAPCRLLDIQELLSDSGVGRQQHIIVSQGQLDEVLNARAEERRAIIEEAAGVLKYRKRKERSERRLAATEENLARIKDIAAEVKRQIRPLRKQADAARRYDSVLTEQRSLKTYLIGRELAALQGKIGTERRQRADLRQHAHELKSTLGQLDAQILTAESELAALGASDIAEVVGQARSLTERIKGQRNVVGERRQRLQGELHVAVDEDVVANLEAESARLEIEKRETLESRHQAIEKLEQLKTNETAVGEKRSAFRSGVGSDPVDVTTEAAELRVRAHAARSALARAEDQYRQVSERLGTVDGRRGELVASVVSLTADADALSTRLPELTDERDSATAEVEHSRTQWEIAANAQREADDDASRWQARAETLNQALADARAQAGIDALAGADGVLGTLLDMVAVDEGWEDATEAAIGEALQAIVIDNPNDARRALGLLDRNQTSGAVLALGALAPPVDIASSFSHRQLRPRVKARRSNVEPLLDALLGNVVVVDGRWDEAVDLILAHPELVIVTKSGSRFSARGWRIGGAGSGATGAALAEAEERSAAAQVAASAAADECSEAQRTLDVVRLQRQQAETRYVQCESDLKTAAAALASVKDEQKRLDSEHEVLKQRSDELAQQINTEQAELALMDQHLPALEATEQQQRVQAAELAATKQRFEQQLRSLAAERTGLEVTVSSLTDYLGQLQTRRSETESRLARLVDERQQARSRRIKIEAALAVVDELEVELTGHQRTVQGWVGQLSAEQQTQSEAARNASDALMRKRKERIAAEQRLAELNEKQNQFELSEMESRVRLESLTEALRQELDTEPEVAMAAEQPTLANDVSAEARLREVERELRLMGAINPLAIEEFEELSERYEFIQSQVDDVMSTRKDLQTLIKSIDTEIVGVFASAFADVAENFVELFTVLFPGGTGALTLTDTDDLLNCGIEVEAKPSGKNVKKLSLLSGGERSLTALAFLFAVFRSRPSPFYVMDEVEAALDDINLTRFLNLVESFREEAQLLIVSHQKRTMESGDVLYGVSMKPGGSSKVVSERVEATIAS